MNKEVLKIKTKLIKEFEKSIKAIKNEKIEAKKLEKELTKAYQPLINFYKKHKSICNPAYALEDDMHDMGLYDEDETYDLEEIIKYYNLLKTTEDENIVEAILILKMYKYIPINTSPAKGNYYSAWKCLPEPIYKIQGNSLQFETCLSKDITLYRVIAADLFIMLNCKDTKEIFKLLSPKKQKALVLKLLNKEPYNLKSCKKLLSFNKDLVDLVAKYQVFNNV